MFKVKALKVLDPCGEVQKGRVVLVAGKLEEAVGSSSLNFWSNWLLD